MTDVCDYGARAAKRLDVFGSAAFAFFDDFDNGVNDAEFIAGPFQKGFGVGWRLLEVHSTIVARQGEKSEQNLCPLDPMTQWGKVPE